MRSNAVLKLLQDSGSGVGKLECRGVDSECFPVWHLVSAQNLPIGTRLYGTYVDWRFVSENFVLRIL